MGPVRVRTSEADSARLTPDPAWSLVDTLEPLLTASTEADAWRIAVQLARRHFGGGLAATIEFVSDDRATFRSTVGFEHPVGLDVFPLAPDSLAVCVRSADGMVISGDILDDPRFAPPGVLLNEQVRSSASASFRLAEGHGGVIGVYSTAPDAFEPPDIAGFDTLARLLGDVIDRTRRARDLAVAAQLDALTGIDNRSTILAELDGRLARGGAVTALVLDLDGFKAINDRFGHGAGDHVLRTVTERVIRSVEANDQLGRLGGDEFLLLVDGDAGVRRAEQIMGRIEEVVMHGVSTISPSASIGIAKSHPGDDARSMLDRAEEMLASAKSSGRGRVKSDQCAPATVHAAGEDDTSRPVIDLALVDHSISELSVVVQPIVAASTGALFGLEALTRGPAGGALERPDHLFEAATTFGRLGELELESKRLAFEIDAHPDFALFINLEPTLLSDTEWLAELGQVWKNSGSTRPVVAELTERAVMERPGRLIAAVEACRSLGWSIALDDVGARSEGLAALRWIEPDFVKLDMSLIRGENRAHSAHVAAAVAAHRATSERRPTVVAEGVETHDDVGLADVLGADLLQGYLYGRPAPAAESTNLERIAIDVSSSRPIPHIGERIGTKTDLLAISRQIESAALSADCIVLSTLQEAGHFTRRTRRQYRALARRCSFVGVLGHGVTSVAESEVSGVRLADLHADDPLIAEWQVLTLSPTVSLGMLAVEIEPEPAAEPNDRDRLFRYELISRPADVERAVRRLLRYF